MSYSLLDAIGKTPLVEIRKLNPNPKVRILAKIEYMNPGGSIKDRAALYMIEAGERSGALTPDKTVIEATSGNTGIGLAMVCTIKGYRLLLAMSDAASEERRKILKARGAQILLTPGHLGTDGAIEEVYRLVRENPDAYFMADQYNNEANWKAHYEGTAVEIWQQTGGSITALVATLGTAGTLMGLSRRLKEYNPDIRIIGVEPYLGHRIQGLKNMKEAYCPEIYDKKRLDLKVNIDDEDAFEMTRKLAREEGLFVGMSSGAAMAVAARQAQEMESGVMVVIFPDSGERYLSTPLFTVRDQAPLKLFNTLTRAKEPFEPSVPGKVSMYTCGPTAHARMGLDECRRFVFSDLLKRYLEYRGFSVKHVMNITDLDDKTIQGSEQAGMPLGEFTGKHLEAIFRDLEFLGIKPADVYPRASEHIEEMIALTQKLVQKGFAYEKLRSIYCDISRLPEYGRLSGIDINKIRIGATVDLDDYEKDNPRDFTLLKRSRLSELKRGIYARTEWGNVRPSWHTQCAAISMKYLGESFDIQTSARELIFPHHENVSAICRAVTGKIPARFWIHSDRVLADGKKLSDGDLTLETLESKGYTRRDIRYWLLSTHYRKPLVFSLESLNHAGSALKRVDNCIQALSEAPDGVSYPEIDQLLYDIKNGFVTAMDDDLNISAAMASVFNVVKTVNKLLFNRQIGGADARKILEAFKGINAALEIFSFETHPLDPGFERLIRQREEARRNKNWKLADEIRNQLIAQGVRLQDDKAE